MTARNKWIQNSKKLHRIKDELEIARLEYHRNNAKLEGDYRLVWVLQTKIKRLKNEIKI